MQSNCTEMPIARERIPTCVNQALAPNDTRRNPADADEVRAGPLPVALGVITS